MASVSTKGQRYIGETKNQLRHGYGVYKYSNKFFTYEGEWKEGKKHGHGKLLMSDGSFYEGEFINGEIEGHGFRRWATTGNTYSGQFCDGELHGTGVLKYGRGGAYEGEWQHNKREGRGVLRLADGTLYEGSFHNNVRHGEGSQKYPNGDLYMGDWIQDKRQGSGELRATDGTIYDGQWRNDMFNGQGVMIHSSGMMYDGMWINGKPAQEAAEIFIVGEKVLELQQGQPFTIEVEIRTADGEIVDAEHKRALRISAGFKHHMPTEGMPLFDLIEEMEETPMKTPYGYDVVTYPLTDYENLKERLDADVLKPPGSATEAPTLTAENLTQDSVSINLEVEADARTETEGGTIKDFDGGLAVDAGVEVAVSEAPPSTAPETIVAPSEAMTGGEISESPLPPPVDNQLVEKGKAEFLDIVLPPAPLGYQPFSILDVMLEEEAQRKAKNSKTAGLANQLRIGAKLNKSIASPTPSGRFHLASPSSGNVHSPPGTPSHKVRVTSATPSVDRETQTPGLVNVSSAHKFVNELSGDEDEMNVKADQMSLERLKDFKLSKAKREKYYGDLRYARPGEYVIMVEDVTNPPFLGVQLPTAFCLVKVAFPKKNAKAKKAKKESKSSSKLSTGGGD